MSDENLAAMPPSYLQPVKQELRGTVHEIFYPVRNYIDHARRLVTDRALEAEAGRERVAGEAIMKPCSLYLPPGYEVANPDVRYRTLYLLHGVGGDHVEWLRGGGKADGRYPLCNLLDNLIAGGDIEPLIAVMPNGRSARDWADRSFNPRGINLLGFYYFDYELRYDLIPFIEGNYRTRADIGDATPEGIRRGRTNRAVAGLSMGGMQVLNLGLGGFRCDSAERLGVDSPWNNGLAETVQAPGMTDLFAYAGAFSNAPTSSPGHVLGARAAAGGHRLHLLYMNCGDADEVAIRSYRASLDGLAESAKEALGELVRVEIKGGLHDFEVWYEGLYHFIRLVGRMEEPSQRLGE